MLSLIETCWAVCCWFSDCTDCWIVHSESRCSIQVSGRALPLQPARKLGNERTRHRVARKNS
jgi:hypothetical protein